MSEEAVIKFLTCVLGNHPFVSTLSKRKVILDGEEGWACLKCYREARIASQLITEGPLAGSTTGDWSSNEWLIIEG